MKRASHATALAAALALTACGGAAPALAPQSQTASSASRAVQSGLGSLSHKAIGFSIDTAARVKNAAALGVNATILYDRVPGPRSPLAQALVAHHMTAIDGGVSSALYYWECHRTHTVAKPPRGENNWYCATDEQPSYNSEAVVLATVAHELARDAKRPYVSGYWILDDWPEWDNGSAYTLLQRVHAEIASITPGRPAICGFGAGIGRGKTYSWYPGLVKNYSDAACDAVGWYNYSPFGRTKPSNGENLNWAMNGLLAAMARSLENAGWNQTQRPLIGIGQAWGGPYEVHNFQPGLSSNEMETQAAAFCSFGADSIAWYAWDDSGFKHGTLTPETSTALDRGISASISDCRAAWQRSVRTMRATSASPG